MSAAIENEIKTNVIKQWLDGDSRDKIASHNQIGAGTVSGIIREYKKGINDLKFESVRELSISCKKQGINLGALASCIRLNNYIQKLGANQDEIEAFVASLANCPEPEKLIDIADQIAQISLSESISLEDLGNRVKQKEEEKQMFEEEIKQRRAILESANIDIMTLKEFKKLKEELNVHGLSLKDPRILLSILKTIRQIGYEPQKIVREFSRIKSLRQTERELNNSRKDLQAQLERYKDVLPLCKQIVGLGIGIGELLAFDTAVCEKAEMLNISRESAAYRVIEDIRDYDKLGGLKNEISKMIMQQYTINQIMAPREKAIAALLRLQALGVTDGEIFNIYEWLNKIREKPLINR